jgi:hypothetical protein
MDPIGAAISRISLCFQAGVGITPDTLSPILPDRQTAGLIVALLLLSPALPLGSACERGFDD